MSDARRLTEAAAKASGKKIRWVDRKRRQEEGYFVLEDGTKWEPAYSDADAFRLADDLLMMVDMGPIRCVVTACCDYHARSERNYEKHDRMQVARLCILMCAEEIASQMKG